MPRTATRRPSPLAVIGVLMLLVGLGCLGWVGWQYLGTNVVSEKAFRSETGQLRSQWQQAAAKTPSAPGKKSAKTTILPGDAEALLRIPRFGADYEVPILNGTDLSILDRGVGHYTETAEPGQIGNFAIAGHRITHGQPFSRLLELDRGDQVVVETRQAVFTYVIDKPARELTVPDTATWVLDPVPDEPKATPTRALITLTTCQDLFHSPDRSVSFGHLASTTNK